MTLVLVVLAVFGCGLVLWLAGERARARLKAATPPAVELIDVGGYRLHMSSLGKGDPAVVFDAGVGGMGLHWAFVQPELARTTRTVIYDRAGLGWSDVSPSSCTFESMAHDLHELPTRAHIPAPYLSVAHSFGGIVVRQFVLQYPATVAMMKVMKWAFRLGIPPLRPSPIPPTKGLPDDIAQTEWVLRVTGGRHTAVMLEEFEAIIHNPPPKLDSLGEIPVVVISHGLPQSMPNFPPETNAAYDQVWQELQTELAALSPNGRRIVAENCDHDIHIENPQLVIKAIEDVLTQERRQPDAAVKESAAAVSA